MVDAILIIKTSLAETAKEAMDLFGEGGDPQSTQVEGFIGYVNTPIGGGYSRVRIAERFGQALEYVAANFGSPNADLVRVEWPLPFDEETQTQPVYEPITFDVEQTDMDGVVTIHQQTVGTII